MPTNETPSGVTVAAYDQINAWYKEAFAELQVEHGTEYPPLEPILRLGDEFRARIHAAQGEFATALTAEQKAERVEAERARMEALAAEAERARMGTPDQVQQALDQFTGHAPAVLQDPRVGKW